MSSSVVVCCLLLGNWSRVGVCHSILRSFQDNHDLHVQPRESINSMLLSRRARSIGTNQRGSWYVVQAFLYSGAVFLTWFLFVIIIIQSLADILPSYGMLYEMTILITLQGPWNLLIYLKPKIEQMKKRKKQNKTKKTAACTYS